MDYQEVSSHSFRDRTGAPLKNRFAAGWWAFLLALPQLLAACAALIPEKTAVVTIIAEPATEMASAQSADFALVGRTSVKGGKESFSGGVQWQHSGSHDEILLLNPLGQTLAQIRRTPEGVHLTTFEQENYYASDVESLTEQVLGWRLPLMGLQYWVRGMNSPATTAAIDKDLDGRVVAIRQDGWKISYSSYFPSSPSQTMQGQVGLPRLLLLTRNGLQIKLVIDTWNFRND